MQPFSYNNRTSQSNQLLPQPQEKQNGKNHKGKKRANKKNEIPEIKELYRCGTTKGVY